jgi:alkylation response protein AidB-like acyl-CoA dehydrogenase
VANSKEAITVTATTGVFDETQLCREVRVWLDRNWDDTLTVREWWRRLVDSGWAFPGWPPEWFGRGYPDEAVAAVHDQLALAGVLGPPGGGVSLAAPVIFLFGTEEQKRRWLPRIAYGEEHWGQFFSEPGAGSDLASVQTRAVRDGDEWVVNGQKVWNSGTLVADRALLVARTDPDVPKHRGLTFFVIDVDQPGIEVRPIKQMNGYAEFNETFFTDARVADADRIGDLNGGWPVALAVLTHERSTFAGGGERELRRADTGSKAGQLTRTVAEVMAEPRHGPMAANGLPIGTVDAVIALARRTGRAGDPVIRQRIAAIHALSEALRFTALRARAATRAGHGGAPESSVAYLGGVKTVRLYRDLVGELAGAETMLGGTEVAETILTAPCHGIQGGSEQIQRNVIGERLLGLPKEPQVDRDVPFRLLKVGTQRP